MAMLPLRIFGLVFVALSVSDCALPATIQDAPAADAKAKPAEAKKWDVDAAPGPKHDVTIDTVKER